jgi:hypothetical protein
MLEPQIVDGFTYSMNLLLLPINYRSAVMAQMETIRLTGNYQHKMFAVPSPTGNDPTAANVIGLIPAYGQTEQQLSLDPGTYIWGWMFGVGIGETAESFHIRVTDACTETALSSDYIFAQLLFEAIVGSATLAAQRGPCLLPQPRLISEPGLVNVEIYNNGSVAASAQLVLFCATPRSGPQPYAFNGNPGWHPNTPRGPQY